MAMRPMVYVWSTPYSGSKKLMLLAIADNAHEDNGMCFPGVETLAEKCGIQVRAAQALITALEKDGEIVVFVGKGTKTAHGWTNLYYMKGYRQSIGLTTPAASTRIEQITPKEVQKTAPLDKTGSKSASNNRGVQNDSSQGVNHSTSQGVNHPASKPLDKPLDKPKEQESPASLLPIDEDTAVPTDSPVGDSLSGDDPVIADAEAVIERAFAADTIEGYCLRCKQTISIQLPQAIMTRSGQPATQGDCPQCGGSVFRMGRTHLHQADEPTSKRFERKPLMEAVRFAFSEPAGPYPAKIGQFLLGKLKRKSKNDEWFAAQPETLITPELAPIQIVAFTLWYGSQDKYKSSFAEQGYVMPTTPSLLRDHWERYLARPQNVHDHWMARAKPILERLLDGEEVRPKEILLGTAVPAAATPKATDAKPYDASTDDTFIDRSNEGLADSAAALLGVS